MDTKERFLISFLGIGKVDLSKLKSQVTHYRHPTDLTKNIGDIKLEFFIDDILIKDISQKDFKKKYEEFVINERNKSINNLIS
jgi:hypothetical protein